MNERLRLGAAVLTAVVLFLLIQLGALALVGPFEAADLQPVEDPDDPTTPLLYIGAILIATVLMLAAFKYNLKRFVRGGVILASIFLSWFVFAVIIPPVVTVVGINLLAVGAALLIGIGLAVYPEWYIIDAAGVVIGAAAAGLFGITFSILPVLILLTALAVYDAISVYGTKHMLSLADGIMDVKVPVLLIIPVSLSYSFLRDPASMSPDDAEAGAAPDLAQSESDSIVPDEAVNVESEEPDGSTDTAPSDEDGPDVSVHQDALFIGLGDAVIPAILVASAAFFAPAPTLDVPVIAVNIPAVTAMIGTIVGLLLLLRMVLEGRPHAGLPLLCGGAILGYFLGALAVGIPPLEALGLAAYL